ncbi:hypothetical protein G9A89_012370 [Geosiphon pyriformis]|nr:hypothetical protein G9A89_012370 [Geosiphon pyriformis]
MGSFSRTVGKLGREVVSLKKEYCMENIDMSDNSKFLLVVSDKVFSNLMFLWEHESVDVKTDLFKTAKWLVGLVSYSATLFSVIQKMLSLEVFTIEYDKSKSFILDYEATVGCSIVVIKKATKVFGSSDGFRSVLLKKKKRGSILEDGSGSKNVGFKVQSNHSWGSETDNTTKYKSINMEEECLIEKTSFNYSKSGALAGGDYDQISMSSKVKTKKALGKPLGKINFSPSSNNDDVLLDAPLVLLLSVKNLVNIFVWKSFALDIRLDKVVGKFSHEKLQVVRKLFSRIIGFGGVSTPSKYAGIVKVTFTSKLSLMKATKLAIDVKILVNTDLKKSSGHSDWAVVVKKIPVGTLVEAMHAVLSKFGIIKSVKMQLVDLWQKVIIEFEDQNQADLLASKWFILIGKNAVCMAKTDLDKQTSDSRDLYKVLLYTLSVETNVHNIWDYIDSVAKCAIVCFGLAELLDAIMGTAPVLRDAHLHWSHLGSAVWMKYRKLGYTSLTLSDIDKSRLAVIYAKHSAPVARPVTFGSASWASIVSGFSFSPFFGCNSLVNSGSSSEIKPIPMVSKELNDRFATLKRSLASLVECVDKLAKRLDSPKPIISQSSPGCQPLVNIVISEGLDMATSSEIIAGVAVFDASVVSKMEDTLKNLSITVMGLSAKINNAGLKFAMCNIWGLNVFTKQNNIICWHKKSGNIVSIVTETKLRSNIRPWIINKFNNVCIFISGLDNGYLGTGIEEVPGHVILVCLLFKGKVSVSIVGLYACAFPGDQFGQAPSINFFIDWMVNSNNFVVLGGNFNKGKSIRSVSFGFCSSLGLVNSFGGHSLAEAFMWSNLRSIEKIIDHVFVSESLISAVASNKVEFVTEFFDTDHRAVSVSVSLDGLLDMRLASIHKHANIDHWKFKLKNVDADGWGHFMECFSVKFLEKLVVFHDAKSCGDLDDIWNVLKEITISSANAIFFKLWYSEFDCVRNKTFLKFHGLELLMSKIVNSMKTGLSLKTDCLVNTWTDLDNDIVHHISVVKKGYHKSKYHEFRVVRDEFIRVATRKCLVSGVLPARWLDQYILLNYIANNVFSGIMSDISLDKLLVVVKKLSDGKTARLSGIPNKLWKHNGSLVLNSLLSTLTNTRSIALVKTAWKILSKILSDRIFLAYILNGTSTQSPIFAVGSIVENTLEKDRELWLVLQDIHKVYDSVSWAHLQNSLIRIKMCSHFINFFGGIHNGRCNRVMMDFGLSDGYIVHNSLDQEEVFSLLLVEHLIEDSLPREILAIKLRKKLMKLQFWKAIDKTITIESLHKPSDHYQLQLDLSIKLQRTSTNTNLKVAESENIRANHLGFVKSLFQHYCQHLGLNHNHISMESAFNFYINERIAYLLRTPVNIELTREVFYSKLIQNTNLPTNHNFAFIIMEINKEIKHHTQQRYPITYTSKGKGKLQTPAVTPNRIQPPTWKKTRIESLANPLYYYTFRKLLGPYELQSPPPPPDFRISDLWEVMESEEKEEEEAEDQEFTYQNLITENPEFETLNLQTQQNLNQENLEIKTPNIQTLPTQDN